MKLKLFTFFLITLITISSFGQTLGYDKMRGSQLVFKNGDILNVKGKLKSKGFKYKKHNTAKPVLVNYSDIESIKIRFNKDIKLVFKPFPIGDSDEIIPVEEVVTGDKISLYSITDSFMSQGAGGIRFRVIRIVYYIKKPYEKKLTKLGSYSPPFGNLKEKVKIIFEDCELLLEKIENKEFRIRSDIEAMFEFYNKGCQ